MSLKGTMQKLSIIFICFITLVTCSKNSKPPNIILILTDDQDLLMGSLSPMKKAQELIGNVGAVFTNAYASTPICCPSRASILSGKYQHNHRTFNNSISGGCNSPDWQENIEPKTFATHLHKSGYRTFYSGKYLNEYGRKTAGGTEHVPPGWDWWMGLVGNSVYYNYTLSVNGTRKEPTDAYLTREIESFAKDFLDSAKYYNNSFLMVLATPAPHAPFTPEPKYTGRYKGIKVPRNPNFNIDVRQDNRHWLVGMPPVPLTSDLIDKVDDIHASRWETLLSVDDLVSTVITKLKDIGQDENTYIVFTSDNGFHLGHYSLPWDKRQLYETDIKVPMLIRGPGIKSKQLIESPVLNIDIAPTILDIAGIEIPDDMDGMSLLPTIKDNGFRPRNFLIEYCGEGNGMAISQECPFKEDINLAECPIEAACKCEDSKNNTYNCLRRIDLPNNNFIYCDFLIEKIREVYDLLNDPYELQNIHHKLTKKSSNEIDQCLHKMMKCAGTSCRSSKALRLVYK
uniref:Sulfatase N-terminal domain-containing protein n=1 Tax=Clastoptera arizonana TaxID=38151 RepID=A0A1B6CPK4_9HEMI